MKTCNRPPFGWYCKKIRGHEGPCPAWPAWWNVKYLIFKVLHQWGSV